MTALMAADFDGSTLGRIRRRVGHELVMWPGATVLVERPDPWILLGLRADNGEWAMPGGGSEEGQSFAATAIAELREEVGLEADTLDLEAYASVSEPADHLVTYPNGDRTHYMGLWFVLRRWRGEPQADGEEMTDVGWFDPDEPPSPLIHSSAVGLDLYRRWLETGRFQAR